MIATRRLLSSLICLLATGCEAYNPACRVDETSVVGQTESFLDLRPAVVRTQEAVVGNLIADALYDALTDNGVAAAVVDAGAIRDRSACGPHAFIDRGPVQLGELADMLPFENNLALVQVNGSELAKVLEHSVARLGEAGPVGQAEQFLQVSHLQFHVDCSKAAQQGDQVGQRITNIALLDRDGVAHPLDVAATYLIATNTRLAAGHDGYTWLNQPRPLTDPPADFMVVANYIASRPGRSVAPTVEGRIVLNDNCETILP